MRLFAVAVLLACVLTDSTFSANAQQQPSAEGDVPGMKVVVQELKRDEGGTVTLRFQLINDSDEEGLSDSCAFRENSSEGCGPMSGVHLLDGANKKKYLVVRDSGKTCVCSQFRPLKKGAKANHWAKFPAPPANVQKVTVVVPQFQPVEGVPIVGP